MPYLKFYFVAGEELVQELNQIIENLPQSSDNFYQVGLEITHERCNNESGITCLSDRKQIASAIYQTSFNLIKIENLFKEAARRSTYKVNRVHYSNYVGLIGQSKIGKTTLVKKIIAHFAENFKFKFYLNFKEMEFNRKKNCLDFLLPAKNLVWMKNRKRLKTELQNIVNEREKVFIVFDELDQAKLVDLSENLPTIGYFDSGTSQSFILNILRGKLFPESKKIVISRSYQTHLLPDECKPLLIVNATGFNNDTQESLCQSNSFDYSKIRNCDHYTDLLSFYAVPLNCLSMIEHYPTSNQGSLVLCSAFSAIFFEFLNVLKKEFNETNILEKLADFAWCHTNENKFLFTYDDFKNANLSEKYINAFFITESWKNNSEGLRNICDIKSRFPCLLIQEFFVAIKLLLSRLSKIEDFFNARNDYLIKDNNYYVILMVLFGFCNKNLQACLNHWFPDRPDWKPQDVIEQLTMSITDQFEMLTDDVSKNEFVSRMNKFLQEIDDERCTNHIRNCLRITE